MKSVGRTLQLLIPLLPLAVMAQQLPQHTMYISNNFVLNPAAAGVEDYTDVKFSARAQWIGIEDAPRTLYASIHAPFNEDINTGRRQGVGGLLVADKAGVTEWVSGLATYAYHLPFTREVKLSMGMGGGFLFRRWDLSGITLRDPLDPQLAVNEDPTIAPVLHAGVWLYSDDFFCGMSSQNLLAFSNGFNRHFFATAGYRFAMGEWYATPSVMLRYVRPAPLSFDVNMKMQYADICWLGLSYRKEMGMAAMAGFFISPSLNVSYAYDFKNANVQHLPGNSHEFVLGLRFNNLKRYRSPRVAW